MRRLNKHLESVDESYAEHFIHAMSFAGAMFLGALACLVHAALPFLCEKTGSNAIERLYDRMVVNRTKAANKSLSEAA